MTHDEKLREWRKRAEAAHLKRRADAFQREIVECEHDWEHWGATRRCNKCLHFEYQGERHGPGINGRYWAMGPA